mgnify:CR=1 FL=1
MIIHYKLKLLGTAVICLSACMLWGMNISGNFDVEKYLSALTANNLVNGKIILAKDSVFTQSGINNKGGKNCVFYLPQHNSPVKKELMRELEDYPIYQMAHDPDFNTKGDEHYSAADYYVYARSYVSMNNAKLFSGVCIGEAYTGGAHPMHLNLVYLINCKSGNSLSVKELIKHDAGGELMSLAYKSYLEHYYLPGGFDSVDEDLRLRKNELFTFTNDKDFLTKFSHIFVSPDYLIVYFPYYDFGAYYEGDCYVPIPLEKLTDLLTSEGKALLLEQ